MDHQAVGRIASTLMAVTCASVTQDIHSMGTEKPVQVNN